MKDVEVIKSFIDIFRKTSNRDKAASFRKSLKNNFNTYRKNKLKEKLEKGKYPLNPDFINKVSVYYQIKSINGERFHRWVMVGLTIALIVATVTNIIIIVR